MAETAFLTLIFVGIGTLVLGVIRTRLNWRSEAPNYRHTWFLDVVLHPERYARENAVSAIRALNFAGLLAIASAVGILLYQTFVDFSAMFTR